MRTQPGAAPRGRFVPSAPEPALSLIEVVGPVAGERVVIIGVGGLDLMCGLIGCGAAETVLLPHGARADPHAADLVVATRVDTPERAQAAVAQGRRALNGAGRIVIEAAAELGEAAARLLRASGFSGVVVRSAAGRTMLTAELPLFGTLGRA